MEIKAVPNAELRRTKRFSLEELFGLKFPAGVPDEVKTVEGFEEPDVLTPSINPNYKFARERLLNFLMALRMKDATYIAGHSGVGKSSFICQVAARLNFNVIRINFDGNTRSSNIIGSIRAKDGGTYFSHGVLIQGFILPGTIIILDEVDACPPEAAFSMQRALEDDHKILIQDTGELFSLHPQNFITATANTFGSGDSSQLYVAGTNVQNFSFMNRFNTVLYFNYMSEKDEMEYLSSAFPDFAKKHDQALKNICSIAATTRQQFEAGNLASPLTHRDTYNWISKMRVMPLPLRTAESSFLNRLNPSEATSIAKLISSKFTTVEGDVTRFLVKT